MDGDDLAYSVIWYDKAGIVAKTPFVTEKGARDHANDMFPARNKNDGIIAVEVCKESGDVIFRRASGSRNANRT